MLIIVVLYLFQFNPFPRLNYLLFCSLSFTSANKRINARTRNERKQITRRNELGPFIVGDFLFGQIAREVFALFLFAAVTTYPVALFAFTTLFLLIQAGRTGTPI